METWAEFNELGADEQTARALAVMADVVKDYGRGYRIDECLYVIGGEGIPAPGCIVGHVLYRLGLDLETMGDPTWNTDAIDCGLPTAAGTVTIPWAAGLHAQTRHMLRAAQRVQDGIAGNGRDTWGAAFEAAQAYAASH